MTLPTAQVTHSQLFPTLLVNDIRSAVDFYTSRLGFSPRFTWGEPPTYAGVDLGQTTLHLAKGTPYVAGHSEVNFVIDNADELYAFHRGNGVEIVEPIDDREYGIRDYKIKDLDGNYLGFGHYIYHLEGPPLKIERVDVPVRLEKRLAALLQDLAEHKGMSLSGCLEETLLHTFERIGDTVASPHTVRTLEYIQELKQKHHIDYDTHASYRFVE
ncbi:VOC family protein [Chitinophaga japonensis]|uniref:Putative glyoxalase superfamily protein PhnB n=1 Tax=Chitinophaga japonensis TaxID=104662 RepID=A0A562TAJ5_CHIJA|nr:VOC family protein [Chitinophaga japonensis]TWI90659.1 putative glyoxalase superfamily protein PhnB [Chitinophaga japonensis]